MCLKRGGDLDPDTAAGRGPGEDEGSDLVMLKQARDHQGWPATHQKLGDRSLTDSPFTALAGTSSTLQPEPQDDNISVALSCSVREMNRSAPRGIN